MVLNLVKVSKLVRTSLRQTDYAYSDSEVKVKGALVQALRLCTGRTAYRGSGGIAVLYRH